MADGTTAAALALAVHGNALYAGGYFTTPGNRVAKWDGTQWTSMGDGVDGHVNALASFGNALYVGGEFTSPGRYIARYAIP